MNPSRETTPKPMIWIITPHAEPERGACVIRMHTFASMLEKNKWDCQLVAPQHDGIESTAQVLRYKGLWSLARLIIKHKPQLIIGTSPPMTHSSIAGIVAWMMRIPFILDVRDPWMEAAIKVGVYPPDSWKVKIYQTLEWITYRIASHILVVSPEVGQRIPARVAEKKLSIIPNGTLPLIFKPDKAMRRECRKKMQIPASATVVLLSGDFGQHGLISFLEKALPVMQKNKAHLIIALSFSGTMNKESIAQFCQTRGFEQFHVVDLPHLELKQVAELFAAADWGVTLVPDGLDYMIPVKTYDYFAAGLFVVARGPPISALRRTMETAQLGSYSSTDTQAAHAMSKAFASKKWKENAHRARVIALEQFDRDLQQEKLTFLVNKFLDTKRGTKWD